MNALQKCLGSTLNKADRAVTELSQETEAAKQLISQLRTMEKASGNEFDDELIADMLEGSTNLLEAIDKLIEIIHADEAWIKGMKEQEAQLEARRKRFEDRNAKRRWAIENALRLAKRDRHPHALVTISYARGRKNAKVEITDELALPAAYWKKKDPEINRQLLAADLREGQVIEGAKLVDGEDGFRWSSK